MKKLSKPTAMLTIIVLMLSMMTLLTGCFDTQAAKVKENLSLEADSFNVIRTVTVINCTTNDVIFTIEGRISITADTSDKQLEILCEYKKGLYKKSIIGIPDFTPITYVVDDKEATATTPYGYKINYNPKMWLPNRPAIVD